MRGAGKWLQVNGEAIYATRPREGTNWSEGDSVRYTRTNDKQFVYAILTRGPRTQVMLKTVQPKVGSKVTLVGSKAALDWKFDAAQGTTITFPENLQQASNRPCEYAWSLKIEPVEA